MFKVDERLVVPSTIPSGSLDEGRPFNYHPCAVDLVQCKVEWKAVCSLEFEEQVTRKHANVINVQLEHTFRYLTVHSIVLDQSQHRFFWFAFG